MSYQDEVVLIMGIFGCLGVVWLVMLILTVIYLSSLARALSKCGASRRTLDPGLVWLNVIPLFHLFWKFWTATQVGTSLRREFHARGLRTGFSFGQPMGVLVPVVALFTRLVFLPGVLIASRMGAEELGWLVIVVTILLGVTEMILLIVHWAQINGYTRQLIDTRPPAETLKGGDDGGARDFDEDYRPIPRRRPPAQQPEG